MFAFFLRYSLSVWESLIQYASNSSIDIGSIIVEIRSSKLLRKVISEVFANIFKMGDIEVE